MTKLFRIILIAVLTFVLLLSTLSFLIKMRGKSLPKDFTEIVADIEATTEIWTNQQAIPHIISQSDNGMFFAMGYFHATQRLWNMNQWKLIATGRVSEFYGKEFLNSDIYMRALDLEQLASDIFSNANEETKEVLIAYTNGVNTYISENKDNLSIEFAASEVVPEAWQAEDCFLLWRFWSFMLSDNFYSDIILSKITKQLGNKGKELFLNIPNTVPVLNDTTKYDSTTSLTSTYNSDLYDNIIKALTKVYSLFGKYGSNVGDNSWAIRKSDGDILLASDSYLPLNLPTAWMQMHLTSPSYNTVGMSIPGIPVIYAGRNDYISWGTSNMMADDIDFFSHSFRNEDCSEYLNSDSTYSKVLYTVDTVKIKRSDEYLYYKNVIANCSVISDNMFSHDNSKTNNNYLTYKWTGQIVSNEIYSLLNIMKARNWNEFCSATRNWNTPGIIFSYADIAGNIGVLPCAYIPIRELGFSQATINPFWKYEKGWLGTRQLDASQKVYNPNSGFVIATNDILQENIEQPHITKLIDSKVKRLNEVLIGLDDYYYRDAQYIQTDILSIYAKEIWEVLDNIFDKYKYLLTKDELKAYYKILKWDNVMSVNSTATSIFNMYISKLVEHTFKDELGDLYELYIFNSNIPLMKLKELLHHPNSAWFDNITTSNNEYLDFIAISSFKDAISELTNLYGSSNSDKWKYGDFHTIKFNSSNYNAYFQNSIETSNVVVGGGIGTINCQNWNLNNPFYITSGASMRFIADMSNNTCYAIVSTGVSGDPISEHYLDQVKLWTIGAYIPLKMDTIPASNFKLSIKITKK